MIGFWRRSNHEHVGRESLNREEIAEAARQATELTEDIEGEFRVPTFQVVLMRLLGMDDWVGIPVRTEAIEAIPALGESNLLEMVNRVRPTTHRERVLLIAHSLRAEGNEAFNVRDLENLYSKLLMPKPKNINDVVNQNRKNGYIVKLDQDKDGMTAFSITRLGMEEVARLEGRQPQ